ncbi:MAG: Ig-like domain-containing protein [Clostridia bacterium]|nr:Ig-like domain-containing protein [Clostridia bacterium]
MFKCKKILSIILAFALILSTLPAFALTAGTAETDGFESATLGPVDLASGYTDSSVWAITDTNTQKVTYFTGTLTDDRITLTVKKESADSANQVMELTQLATGSCSGVTTKYTKFSDGFDAVYTTFKFKIPAENGTGQWFITAGATGNSYYTDQGLIGIRSGNKIYKSDSDSSKSAMGYVDSTSGKTYQRDTWYTVLVKTTKTGAEAYVYGDNGILQQNTITGNFKGSRVGVMYRTNDYLVPANGFTIQLDDAKLLGVQEATDSVRLTGSSVSEGQTEVDRKPVIDLTFDRPMAEYTSGITCSDSSKAFTVKNISDNTLRVAFTDMLDFSTTYTLNFSGVKDMLGHTPDGTTSLSFTTVYLPLSIYGADTALLKSGSTLEGSDLTFSVKNHTGADLPAALMLALYQKTGNGERLLAVQQQNVIVAPDAETLTFALSGKYHDVSKVRLMAFSDMDSLQPIAETCEVVISEDVPVYNVDRFEKKLLFKQDFEGGTLPSNVTASASYDAERIDDTVGYGGEGSAYKVDGSEAKGESAGQTNLWYKISGLNIPAGSGFLMSAMFKTEGLTGTIAQGGGDAYAEGCRTSLRISGVDENGNRKSENIYMIDETINGTKDWTESMQYFVSDFTVNTVTVTCYLYYELDAGQVVGGINRGTAWYDDICLYQVGYDPFLEAILEQPTYKGFVYGDGGENDIIVTSSVKDYGNVYDLSNCVVQAKIVDALGSTIASQEIQDIPDEIKITFSSGILAMNQDYYLQLLLVDQSSGKQHGFREWTIRKRPEDWRPNNYFDEYGRFVIDGEPTFLMGIYGMNDLRGAIDDMTGTPINVLMPYGYAWLPLSVDSEGNAVANADQTILDYAEEKGVKLVASLKNYYFSKVQSTGLFRNVIREPHHARQVFEGFTEALDHPAVLGYYMADELSAERYGAEVEWASKILSDLDPDGFTINVFSPEAESRSQIRFADTSNTYSYPIGTTVKNLSSVTNNVSDVLNHVPAGNRPFIAVLQSAGITEAGKTDPTKDEMRNMAWQAVCAGMQGIIWYNHFDMVKDTDEFEGSWANLVTVCEELEAYYPVILSTEKAPEITAEAGDWFTSIAKRYNGKDYLFTTNTTRSEHTARIHVGNATTVKAVYGNTTYTPDADGYISVTYPSIGVEIFEIER